MKFKFWIQQTIRILLVFLISFTWLSPLLIPKASALTIEIGDYYYIASALDTNKVLDVSGGSHSDGANIQLYEKNGTDAQLFKIVHSVDGYFSIINKGSGKALDIQGGGTESGTNVQLYTPNNTAAQQWQFYYAYNSNENISIKARCGKFLDVCGGETKNGTNIWIYDGNNTAAQAFKLIPYVNTTYKTVKLDFNDYNSWKKQMESAQRSVTFGGTYGVNPSGNGYYTGNIITDMTVLSWKTIDIKIPLPGPGNPYKSTAIQLPSEVRFKLHTHNRDVKMWFNVSRLDYWQQCECGYRDEWSWELPWPDSSDAQTTQSVIKQIAPRHIVLYTVQ